MHLSFSRIIQWITAVVLAIASLKCVALLWHVSALEAGGSVNDDYQAFVVVARGILNGLKPYADLFDARPPGTFLIVTLSLALTNGEKIATILQITTLLMLPLLLAGYALMMNREHRRLDRFSLTALAFLLGTMLALLLEQRAGALQSEAFGSLFGCLFALLAVWSLDHRMPRTLLILSAIFLMFCVGIKEPFLFTMIAIALMVFPGVKQWNTYFLLPLLIAIVAGIVLLAMIGWFVPFVHIYLPAVFNMQIIDIHEPVFLRGWNTLRLFRNLTTHSFQPYFGYLLILLWAMLSSIPERWSTVGAVVSAFLWLFSALLLNAFWGIGVLLLSFLNNDALPAYFVDILTVLSPLHVDPSLLFIMLCIIPVIAYGFILYYVQHTDALRVSLKKLVLSLLVIVLVMTAVALSGNFNHYHYAFPIPFFFALLLLFVRFASQSPQRRFIIISVALLSLLSIFTTVIPSSVDTYLQSNYQLNEMTNRNEAAAFDGLLDHCSVDRYFSVGTHRFLAYARHVPIGPMTYLGPHLYFYDQTTDNLKMYAQVIAIPRDSPILHPEEQWISTHFTPALPPCTKGLPLPEHVRLLFRNDERAQAFGKL
ncbi:MAG: hypothetical protein WCG83_01085 [Candidatus Peregrinibacteria bacterium]